MKMSPNIDVFVNPCLVGQLVIITLEIVQTESQLAN